MIVDVPTTVVKSTRKPAPPAPVPTLAFLHGEWKAFQNGLLCSLLGYDGATLKDAREQWSRPHRWAWDTGHNVMTKLTARADVQLALTLRFGGMEE